MFSSAGGAGIFSTSFFSSAAGGASASSASGIFLSSSIGLAESFSPSSTFVGDAFEGEFFFESSPPTLGTGSNRYCANTEPVVGHFAKRFSTISSCLKLIFLCLPSKELEWIL